MIKEELLEKFSDEKIDKTLDRLIGNQQDYMSLIFDDPVYKEYREKYDKQYEINKKIYQEKLEQYNSRSRPNSFLMTWKEVEKRYTSPKECKFYRIKNRQNEPICMAVIVLSKGTLKHLPDIRIAYVKKNVKDKANFNYAKEIAFDRVRQVAYKDSTNGISDGEMNFRLSKKTKKSIESVKTELIREFDEPIPSIEEPYFPDKKYEKYQSMGRPESMLKLVRDVMPKICANEYVTIIPETEKDKIIYSKDLRGQK